MSVMVEQRFCVVSGQVLTRLLSVIVLHSATVLTLTACTQDAENAQNAVATGGEFEFISPGGEREIHYEEADRKPLRSFSGADVRDTC